MTAFSSSAIRAAVALSGAGLCWGGGLLRGRGCALGELRLRHGGPVHSLVHEHAGEKAGREEAQGKKEKPEAGEEDDV